jgi:hypothetical protein
MIPYKWPVATAIPQNPQVRLEIAKALRTLLEDGDEQLRQRRAEIASIREDLAKIAQDIATFEHAARKLILPELRNYGYNPDEPRVPKHNTGGGQWTHVAANGSPNDASDGGEFTRQPYADGHHWVPKQLWRKEPFPTETKAVFNKSKSGPLADPSVNFNDAEHRAYNDAVKKLLDGFLERNTITKEQMTPAQAEEFVQEVKGSVDPRIREFVLKIEREALKYFMRYGPEGRGGGGDEE